MADTVTSQKLVDGPRKVIYKLTNVSDGTGESAVLKVDVSALSGSPSSVRIDSVQYDIQGMTVTLLWDADTDVTALVLGAGQGGMDFQWFGGLANNAGTGVTGDIKLTTTGASSGDTYTIILECTK